MKLKNIICNGIVLASLVGGISGCAGDYLNPVELAKVKGIKHKVEVGELWGAYAHESNISGRSANWSDYQDEVRRRNHGEVAGNLELPDLDGDGKVGK